jgi:hypothetical protein
MGLAEIQSALARLYVDPALRDRFFADPAAVGDELELCEAEARGLAEVSRRQVEQFAGSLKNKRREQVRRFLPIAARALGGRFGGLFARYVDGSAPRGSRADLDDALGFVEALARWTDDDRPPWAVEVARYELAWYQAARSGRRPVVRAFRYSVARLATGRRLDSSPVEPRPTLAIWWRPTPRGRIRHLVVTLPAFALRPARRAARRSPEPAEPANPRR